MVEGRGGARWRIGLRGGRRVVVVVAVVVVVRVVVVVAVVVAVGFEVEVCNWREGW
jgi:hypothetical protein